MMEKIHVTCRVLFLVNPFSGVRTMVMIMSMGMMPLMMVMLMMMLSMIMMMLSTCALNPINKPTLATERCSQQMLLTSS